MSSVQSSGVAPIAASGSGLSAEDVAGLRARLGGPVLVPDDDGYDEVRGIWNGMIDRASGSDRPVP